MAGGIEGEACMSTPTDADFVFSASLESVLIAQWIDWILNCVL